MSRDGLQVRAAGLLSPPGTPALALALQGVWSAVLALSGTYGDLLDYVIFAALLFYALTVAATLRYDTHATTAKRALTYAYIVVAAAIMLDLLLVKPRFTWPGLAIVASGVPVYAIWRRRAAPSLS
jgi:APA family basic amino acid/polyamine antiporter